MADRTAEVTRRERFAGYRNHLRMLWNVAPGRTICCAATTTVVSGCAILNMVMVGQLVGALAGVVLRHNGTGRLWTWFGLFAGASIVSQLAVFVRSWCAARVNAAYRIRTDELVAELGLHPRDLGQLENEEFGGVLKSLADNSRNWLFRFGLTGTWDLLGAKLTAFGSAAIVLSWCWWASFVVIGAFVTVSRLTGNWIEVLFDGLFSKPENERLRAQYISRLMIHPAAAKEIRLFGIGEWLQRRYSLLWHAFEDRFWREARGKLLPVVAACAGAR